MVYAPIKVAPDVDLSAAPTKVGLSISNYCSFTDLSEIRTHWRLLRDGKLVKRGTARLKLAPRSKGKVELALPVLPADKAPDTLRLDLDHPQGWNVASYQCALSKPAPAFVLAPDLPTDLLFPQLNLVHNVTVNDPVHWRKITRYRGKLINAKAEPASDQDLSRRPLHEVRSVEADIVLEGDSAVVARLRASFSDGEFRYRLEWSGKQADIQELGWVFQMPASCDRFSWQREACWSAYPDTHIGRPTGTARPESADVHLTDITRPDAFDFNSTKYDCDWATLTTARGNGLRVEFAPDQRHHARAGISANDGYQLIVNRQCSPPRDISTPAVPDFYLTLHPGDVVEGSFRVGSNRRSKP